MSKVLVYVLCDIGCREDGFMILGAQSVLEAWLPGESMEVQRATEACVRMQLGKANDCWPAVLERKE